MAVNVLEANFDTDIGLSNLRFPSVVTYTGQYDPISHLLSYSSTLIWMKVSCDVLRRQTLHCFHCPLRQLRDLSGSCRMFTMHAPAFSHAPIWLASCPNAPPSLRCCCCCCCCCLGVGVISSVGKRWWFPQRHVSRMPLSESEEFVEDVAVAIIASWGCWYWEICFILKSIAIIASCENFIKSSI